jgi:hypothetical protein
MSRDKSEVFDGSICSSDRREDLSRRSCGGSHFHGPEGMSTCVFVNDVEFGSPTTWERTERRAETPAAPIAIVKVLTLGSETSLDASWVTVAARPALTAARRHRSRSRRENIRDLSRG